MDFQDENTPLEKFKVLDDPVVRSIIDRYLFAANFVYGKTVVDCSCGYGVGTKLFSVFGGTRVMGIDKNKALIKNVIAQNTDSKVLFACEDLEKDKWTEKYEYDVVISLETIEHINPSKIHIALNHLNRLCKKGGVIIITTPRGGRDGEKTPLGGGHKYEYTVKEFQELIEKYFIGNKTYYVFNELNETEQGSMIYNYLTVYSDNPFGPCRVIAVVIQKQ